MKRNWVGIGGLIVALFMLTTVPRLLSAPVGQRFPVSLWPVIDAASDLGVAGPLETPYRWRNLWLASAAMLGATEANAGEGELLFIGRENGGGAPGQGVLKLFVRRGTNTGTCQIVAVAGTSNTVTVITDNIGGGGC